MSKSHVSVPLSSGGERKTVSGERARTCALRFPVPSGAALARLFNDIWIECILRPAFQFPALFLFRSVRESIGPIDRKESLAGCFLSSSGRSFFSSPGLYYPPCPFVYCFHYLSVLSELYLCVPCPRLECGSSCIRHVVLVLSFYLLQSPEPWIISSRRFSHSALLVSSFGEELRDSPLLSFFPRFSVPLSLLIRPMSPPPRPSPARSPVNPVLKRYPAASQGGTFNPGIPPSLPP